MGMVIAPCSVRSMGEIASGVTSSLLSRAADVVSKERRRLVLMLRETPFHAGHIRQMQTVTEMGAIVAPPVPAFYARPKASKKWWTRQLGARLISSTSISALPNVGARTSSGWNETPVPRTWSCRDI